MAVYGFSALLNTCHVWLKRGCNVFEAFKKKAVYKHENIFSALTESVSGLICISICFFFFSVCKRYHKPHLDKARESCQRPF